MKTIGVLGGMSWESTALYYRLLNEATRERLGGLHSAPIAMISVDFAPIEVLQKAGDWDALALEMIRVARQVEAVGAEFLVVASNTMHKVADETARAVSIPLLHIADATAAAVQSAGHRTVGLLGTRFTMEEDFYRIRLEALGLNVLIPDAKDRTLVNDVIYRELCQGEIRSESRASFLAIIDSLRDAGADAVIEGCTEIGMLVKQADTAAPLFDTTEIHVRAAVDKALDQATTS